MKKMILIFIATFAIVQLYGCSVLGFVVGSGIDQREYQDPRLLEPGRHIQVTLKSGDRLEGNSSSVFRLGANAYQEFIEKARREGGDRVWIPNAGERIALDIDLSGELKTQEARFLGFDRGRVWVVPTDTKPDTGFIELLNLRVIRNPFTPALSLTSEEIVRLEISGILPSLSALSVESTEGKKVIPLSLISHVKSASSSAKWWGLGIGLALDAFIVYEAVTNFSISLFPAGTHF